MVRNISMLEGVTVARSEKQKDEIILTGNDIEKVSQSGTQLINFFF
jgi:large subunit ribosomal protein L9e